MIASASAAPGVPAPRDRHADAGPEHADDHWLPDPSWPVPPRGWQLWAAAERYGAHDRPGEGVELTDGPPTDDDPVGPRTTGPLDRSDDGAPVVAAPATGALVAATIVGLLVLVGTSNTGIGGGLLALGGALLVVAATALVRGRVDWAHVDGRRGAGGLMGVALATLAAGSVIGPSPSSSPAPGSGDGSEPGPASSVIDSPSVPSSPAGAGTLPHSAATVTSPTASATAPAGLPPAHTLPPPATASGVGRGPVTGSVPGRTTPATRSRTPDPQPTTSGVTADTADTAPSAPVQGGEQGASMTLPTLVPTAPGRAPGQGSGQGSDHRSASGAEHAADKNDKNADKKADKVADEDADKAADGAGGPVARGDTDAGAEQR